MGENIISNPNNFIENKGLELVNSHKNFLEHIKSGNDVLSSGMITQDEYNKEIERQIKNNVSSLIYTIEDLKLQIELGNPEEIKKGKLLIFNLLSFAIFDRENNLSAITEKQQMKIVELKYYFEKEKYRNNVEKAIFKKARS